MTKTVDVLVSCPTDADRFVRVIRQALQVDWPLGIGRPYANRITLHVNHWEDTYIAGHYPDGPQAYVNDELVGQAHALIAIFDRTVGTSWSSQLLDEAFKSGTDAELKLAGRAGKPVRIYATPDSPKRSQELRDYLKQLIDDGWTVQTITNETDLAPMVQTLITDWVTRRQIRATQATTLVASSDPSGRVPPCPSPYQPRHAETKILEAWESGHPMVALTGGGGFGKSSIAKRIAHAALDPTKLSDFSADLVVWISNASPTTATTTYAQAWYTLVAADVPNVVDEVQDFYDWPDAMSRDAVRFLRYLQITNLDWLVILDDPPNIQELTKGIELPDGSHVSLLPPHQPGASSSANRAAGIGRTLITTRETAYSRARRVPTELFTSDEALLFVRAVGEDTNQYLATVDDDAILRLADRLDFHPLALGVAVTTIGFAAPIDTWIAALDNIKYHHTVMNKTSSTDDYSRTLADVWLVTLRRLTNQSNDPTVNKDVIMRAACVAAMLGPNGHSGQLWQDEALGSWIAPAGLARAVPGAAPDVLGLLTQHSIVTWNDTTWPTPKSTDPFPIITMHRMAVEAVLDTSWDDIGNQQMRVLGTTLANALCQRLNTVDSGGNPIVNTDVPALVSVFATLNTHKCFIRKDADLFERVNDSLSPLTSLGYPTITRDATSRLLFLAESILGPNHPDTLASRNNLAGAYRSVGGLERAIPLYERTLTDTEHTLGPNHPQTLALRNNLAGAYRSAGNLDRAIPLFEQTLTDRERILGPNHPQTLASRNNLAHAYLQAGQFNATQPTIA